MEGVLNWGVELILLIQQNRTALLDAFFRAITTTGGKRHIHTVPFVIWRLSPLAASRMPPTLFLPALVNFRLTALHPHHRYLHIQPRHRPGRG